MLLKTFFVFLTILLVISCGSVELIGADGNTIGTYGTIQEAFEELSNPGEQVIISGGTYYETVSIESVQGTEENPIIVKAKDGENVIIDGSFEPLTKTQNNQWSSSSLGSGYYQTDISSYNCGSYTDTFGSFEDHLRLFTYGTEDEMKEFYAGQGIYWDTDNDILHIKLNDDQDPNEVALFISCYKVFKLYKSHWIDISDLTIQNGGKRMITFEYSCDNIFHDITARSAARAFQIYKSTTDNPCDRNIIQNNKVINIRDENWYWSDVKNHDSSSMESSAIRAEGGSDTIIEGNDVSGYFNGINVGGDTDDLNNRLIVRNNIIHGIPDDPIECDLYSKDIQVYGNVIYNSRRGISLAPGIGPLYVYRNLIITDMTIKYNRDGDSVSHPGSVKLTHGYSESGKDVYFYHNTVYSTAGLFDGPHSEQAVDNYYFYNNIFYTESMDTLTIMSYLGLKSKNVDWDGNVYYVSTENQKANLFKYYNTYSTSGDYETLAEALDSTDGKNSGWENNGMETDPLFVKKGTYDKFDYYLKEASPCIDKAIEINSEWPDTATKVGDNYDIGAFEYDQDHDNTDTNDDDDDDTASSVSKIIFHFNILILLFVFLFY
ncbi:pectate lyase (eurofung) [Anaeramoeba flamelloides]|uniref:Pectate lyase (Eurofung) n=1 Tax=Anaeramoeba flamelloides TaxID=1746091 RepID=A0AAV8AG51_9EUKA|nr:pectate lyase (eurofung) [Anaeramoeba flamelloides]